MAEVQEQRRVEQALAADSPVSRIQKADTQIGLSVGQVREGTRTI